MGRPTNWKFATLVLLSLNAEAGRTELNFSPTEFSAISVSELSAEKFIVLAINGNIEGSDKANQMIAQFESGKTKAEILKFQRKHQAEFVANLLTIDQTQIERMFARIRSLSPKRILVWLNSGGGVVADYEMLIGHLRELCGSGKTCEGFDSFVDNGKVCVSVCRNFCGRRKSLGGSHGALRFPRRCHPKSLPAGRTWRRETRSAKGDRDRKG